MIEWTVVAESQETGSPLFFSSSQEVDMQELQDEALLLLGEVRKGQPLASVEMEVGVTQKIQDNWVRIRASVRVSCAQTDELIERAANYSLIKANEFVRGTIHLLEKVP